MARKIELVQVSIENGKTQQSNKFYKMTENPNGTWLAEWGRVGSSGQSMTYPSGDWDKKYREKIAKGYKDVTHLKVESLDSFSKTLITPSSTPKEVQNLITSLQLFAKGSIKANYTVSSEVVTQKMIEEAQKIINLLSPKVKINADIHMLNENLIEVFHAIPRKMNDVRKCLFQPIKDKISLEEARKLLLNEQDLLDIMAGQVKLQSIQAPQSSTQKSLLEMMGIEASFVNDDKEIDKVKRMMGNGYDRQFRRLFKVANLETEKRFNSFKPIANNIQLFWHGSRNENWFNILQTGLLIRPSGAITTGSMYGDGIYGANQFHKSANYTSLSGSYWANGNSSVAYIALFNFQLGKEKHIYHHDYTCHSLSWDKLNRERCDSVYAHKGADLMNDEFVVYRSDQVTIKYIMEIGK